MATHAGEEYQPPRSAECNVPVVMLPSTDNCTSWINCPFYDDGGGGGGSCNRPYYCHHFRHAEREDADSAARVAGTVENQTARQIQEDKFINFVASVASDMLRHIVTEAANKVLVNQKITDTEKVSHNIASQVMQKLRLTLSSGSAAAVRNATSTIEKHVAIPTTITKPVTCVCNPTPIEAELKKRHLPVASYIPTRESRVAAKRKFSSPDRIAESWASSDQVRESSDCQTTSTVDAYKLGATVNTTAQDQQSNVPATVVEVDTFTAISYANEKYNDWQCKFREEYCPKRKKRWDKFVTKRRNRLPLQTIQQFYNTTASPYDYKSDTTDESDCSNHATFAASRRAETSADEDFGESFLDIEPTLSECEFVENACTDKCDASVKESKQTEIVNVEDKENLPYAARVDIADKRASDRDDKVHANHYHAKTRDVKSSDKLQQHKAASDEMKKLSDKREESARRDKEEETDENYGKNTERDSTTSRRSFDERDKDKFGHKSKSTDKHPSSSSSTVRDEERKSSRRDNNQDSIYKGGKYSHSSKPVVHTCLRKEENDVCKLSSQRDKQTSSLISSNFKASKHTSAKSDGKRRRLEASQRCSDSLGKSNKHTDGSSGRKLCDGSDGPVDGTHSLVDDPNKMTEETLELCDSNRNVVKECQIVCQKYQASDDSTLVSAETSLREEDNTENVEKVGEKRFAHPWAATSVTRQPGPSQPPKKLTTTLQEKMYERGRLMRRQAAAVTGMAATEKATEKAAAAEMKTLVASKSANLSLSNVPQRASAHEKHVDAASSMSNSDVLLNTNGRIRIAHIAAYTKSFTMEKNKVMVTTAEGKSGDSKRLLNDKTIGQTTKSGVRVARTAQGVPQLVVRPKPLLVTVEKFPLNIRQYYINVMHALCVQIYRNSDDAAQRAVREELACHERFKELAVYKQSCMLAARRLKEQVDRSNAAIRGKFVVGSSCGTVMSHKAVPVGVVVAATGKSSGSWSIIKSKKNVVDFKGPAFYNMLKKWILSEQQLRDNGFPRRHPDGTKGHAKVYAKNLWNRTYLSKVPNERICTRCGQAYMVDRQGFAVRREICVYHWGRKFTVKEESRYSCCKQYDSAIGCCDAETHVWDYTDRDNLDGYVATAASKDGRPPDEQGVYALDCEMCYTTRGLELIRVTIVDQDCKVLYNTLVKPQNPIIDYNTRFSGITPEDLRNVTTTISDVQATLLDMCSDETILVGHSLENDLRAVRLIHSTVVDTSVMFPHKNGYPQKRALKNLCAEYLRKIIQNDVYGHDSKEDAVSCMELIRWRVKEEAKLRSFSR